jgi:hypothetical protein
MVDRVRTHVTLAAVAAIAFATLTAGQASAFTPDGTATITITSLDAAQESAEITIAGECPTTTASATVDWSWTDGSGPDGVQSVAVLNGADGTFSDDWPVFNVVNPDAPGTPITFDLTCRDAGNLVLATATQVYVIPDFAQTLSVPAAVVTSADVIANVDCGTAPADTLYVTHYLGGFELVSDWLAYTGPGAYNLGNAGVLGYAAGDTAELRVMCQTSLPSTHYSSYRLVSYAVTAVPPVVPQAGGGTQALAFTGPHAEAGAMAAALLLLAGVAVLRWRRIRDNGTAPAQHLL